MRPLREGDAVVLVVPDNPRLDGASAVIVGVEDWGYHVETQAAATGRFRALAQEVEPEIIHAAVMSGNACDACGSFNLRRVGTCLLCTDCGTSGGC